MSDDPASKDGLRWEIRQRLVERLRIRWDAMGEMANQQRSEAAVQISTMMDEIEAWRQAAQKADRDIAQVRAERDEARRWCCELLAGDVKPRNTKMSAADYADSLSWDCFKEKR